jgi:hypothetical protein
MSVHNIKFIKLNSEFNSEFKLMSVHNIKFINVVYRPTINTLIDS